MKRILLFLLLITCTYGMSQEVHICSDENIPQLNFAVSELQTALTKKDIKSKKLSLNQWNSEFKDTNVIFFLKRQLKVGSRLALPFPQLPHSASRGKLHE